MPRPSTPLPANTEQDLRRLLRTRARTKRDAQRIQCVLCRVAEKYTAEKTARIVGLSEPTVKRIWSQYLHEGEAALLGEKRGRARGRAHLTPEAERGLLAPFLRAAEHGKLTTVRDVYAAHCACVGRRLDVAVTYRLLNRHGWRKIVPRPSHPKADKEAQKTFKVFFPQGDYTGKNRSAPLWSPFPADVPG